VDSDFLAYAGKIEHLSFEHYSNLADTVPIIELSSIFRFMANEERRHFEIFTSWRSNHHNPPQLSEFRIAEFASKVFQTLSDRFKTNGVVPAIGFDNAYTAALQFESTCIEIYDEALDGEEFCDRGQRTMLESIIYQETIHKRIIMLLMEFQHHPGEWYDNALQR